MVVDDILNDRQTGLVAGVDELHVAERTSVPLMNGVPEHAVVAPVVRAVEGIDGHQLNEVDPELDEMVEPIDRSCQSPFGGEGTDMQLVDDAACELPAGPLLVRPNELFRIEGPRPTVNSVGLASGARIWKHGVGVIENETVIELTDPPIPRSSTVRRWLGGPPPPVVVALLGQSDRRIVADLLDRQPD